MADGLRYPFEREDAARRLLQEEIDKRGPDTILSLFYVRAWTRRGAAKAALKEKGELIERSAMSAAERQDFEKHERADRRRRATLDVPLYRALIDEALARHPQYRTHFSVPTDLNDPERETILLGYFVAGLYRCGALAPDRIVAFQKTLNFGYSDHLLTQLYTDLPALSVLAARDEIATTSAP